MKDEQKDQQEEKKQFVLDANSLFERVKAKTIPNTWSQPRELALYTKPMERSLWSDFDNNTQLGIYVIGKMPRNITQTDFLAYIVAVSQTLSNQSKQTRRTEKDSDFVGLKAYNFGGEDWASIRVSLADLCRLGYGETKPNPRHKEAMRTLIRVLHSTEIKIKTPEKEKTIPLHSRIEETLDKRTNAITYTLLINPIFKRGITTNFAEFPKDYFLHLRNVSKNINHLHYTLSMILAAQDKRKPYKRDFASFIEEIGLNEYYRKDKKRALKTLCNVLDDMKKGEENLIKTWEISTDKNPSITIFLNENFSKKRVVPFSEIG